MLLRPLKLSDISIAAKWLAREDNYRWLDFGGGRQILSAASLKIMSQRDIHLLRIYCKGNDGPPVGLVALSDVDRIFRTARLWYVLGEKDFGGRGFTTRAVSLILDEGFEDLGLGAVNAWTVEHNLASIRILESNNFRRIGRQRKSHYIGGRPYDRVLFDLTAEDHVSRNP
jgi:RimJ/RimL family protein N-acetyltransferase